MSGLVAGNLDNMLMTTWSGSRDAGAVGASAWVGLGMLLFFCSELGIPNFLWTYYACSLERDGQFMAAVWALLHIRKQKQFRRFTYDLFSGGSLYRSFS